MSEKYEWQEVKMGFIETEPATFHRWVWFWQVGHFKVRGWKVEDRTFLMAKVTREMRLEDYIYGDGAKPMGLSAALTQPLFADCGSTTPIKSNWWKNRV